MSATDRLLARSDLPRSTSAARREALDAERTPPFRLLVRVGFLARGVTYGVIGAIALALAIGAGSAAATPNQQGALSLIASAPLGRVALVVIAAGLLTYALWKIGQGAFGHGPEGGGSPDLKQRVANIAGGVAYLAFFGVAVKVLAGSGGSGSSQQKQAAAGVLGWPGGQVLVGIAGGVLIAVGVVQGFNAARAKFAEDIKLAQMTDAEYRLFVALGGIGLVARALVFALVGYFLIRTAVEFDASKALGVDGTLAEVHRQPYGPWLLALVAAGLIAFALFSCLEARYRRL